MTSQVSPLLTWCCEDEFAGFAAFGPGDMTSQTSLLLPVYHYFAGFVDAHPGVAMA